MEAKKIEELVRQAGGLLLQAQLQQEDIEQKSGEANFVTVYDKKIQRFLIRELSRVMPGAGFFGEEDTEGNEHSLEGYTFYIDPIDGTTNFLFDYKHSCVSVGLAFQGIMIAGWVYKPYSDEMWYAVRGEGAYLNGRRLFMEDMGLEEGVAAFGCARYNNRDVDRMFETAKACFLKALAIRNGGSAVLDLCRTASGSNVVYFELLLQPYDYAAASVIIEEAGGWIGQEDGRKITLDGPCSIVGGTKKACLQVRELLSRREENV